MQFNIKSANCFQIFGKMKPMIVFWSDLSLFGQTGLTLYYIAMCCRNCIYWVEWNANLCWCFADDHHPPPTFTPPELPKKVHVRGTSQAPSRVFFFLFSFNHRPTDPFDRQYASSPVTGRYRAPSCFVTHYFIARTDSGGRQPRQQ